MLLNLVFEGEDDDGQGAAETISAAQAEELEAMISSVGANRSAFLGVFKIAEVHELPTKRFAEAKTKLQLFRQQAEQRARGGRP